MRTPVFHGGFVTFAVKCYPTASFFYQRVSKHPALVHKQIQARTRRKHARERQKERESERESPRGGRRSDWIEAGGGEGGQIRWRLAGLLGHPVVGERRAQGRKEDDGKECGQVGRGLADTHEVRPYWEQKAQPQDFSSL